jgi:hypothetical protein
MKSKLPTFNEFISEQLNEASSKPTSKQLKMIKLLGGDKSDVETKKDASEKIKSLKSDIVTNPVSIFYYEGETLDRSSVLLATPKMLGLDKKNMPEFLQVTNRYGYDYLYQLFDGSQGSYNPPKVGEWRYKLIGPKNKFKPPLEVSVRWNPSEN